jgi:hypothetical protein
MYLGMTLERAAHVFGWGELFNFSQHLPESSATYRALHADAYRYSSTLQQSAMLADLIDITTALVYSVNHMAGGHMKRPKPYPRPWVDDKDEKKIGAEPIPISDFDEWYYGGEK